MEDDGELATAVLLSPTRDPAKNGEIAQRWMEMVLGEKFRTAFPAVLLSGERLGDLANKVFRALGMSDELVVERVDPGGVGDKSKPSDAARSNVRSYLSACETIGVGVDDLFEPDDLLFQRDIGKVYRNILALQCVAVSMSSRRSIDERSSMVGANVMEMSPLSEHGVFDEDEEDVDSPSSANLIQQTRWQRLLFEFEYQLLRQAERDEDGANAEHEGMGQLAHDIWRTEERIRTIIARQDRDYGAVPDDLHGKLWMLASGAQMEMRKHKGLYERLFAMETTSTDATMQIDVDLHRTVAECDKEWWSPEKTEMMRRVLVAYSFYNPSIGYCQGLNYIVARSLQFLQEEEAFYLLIKMIGLVPDDYYTTMLGLVVDQHVFADLVRIQLPDVAEHLGNLGGTGMDLSLACTEWFLTLFSSPCERDVTIQIWDVIFLFGDELLFRVALALLRSSKDELLKATIYGDILKILNELGREKVSPVSLVKSAWKQDAVIRARVDEFRAHHRLQLASGIVASSVDTGHSNQSSVGRASTGSRPEPRVRQLIKQQKKKMFRMDRNAGRLSRTFDRNLNDEHIQSLRQEDQGRAEYYLGDSPIVVDDYWGSRDSYRQWGSKDIRMVHSSPERASSASPDRDYDNHSPIVQRMSAHHPRLSGSTGSGQGRERRSKSSAFIPSRKSSNPSLPVHAKDGENDSPLLGRSPKSWLQKRIDEWQKKNQKDKEKKKQEKNRHHPHRGDSELSSLPSRPSSQVLTPASSTAPPPLSMFKSHSRSSNGTAFDRQTKKAGRHASPAARPLSIDTTLVSQLTISRSFSDPFHSPTDSMRPSSLRDPARRARHDAIDAQILVRSQDSGCTPVFGSRSNSDSTTLGKTPLNHPNSMWPMPSNGASNIDASTQPAPSTSAPTRSRRRSRSKSNSRGSRRSRHQHADLHEEKKEIAVELSNPLAEELLLDSPIHDRSQSVELTEVEFLDKPTVRRNVSLPVGAVTAPRGHAPRHPRNPKRLTSENAQAIRERAHVVSYIQRKASDASSLTGSFPRSPREWPEMATRLSTSSSDSSREAILGSNRSGGGYRKGSFSFFDKLSSDLESFADDLNSAFPSYDDGTGEDLESKERASVEV